MLLSRYDESRARCEEAIGIARSVGARAEEGHALNTLGVDLACLGDPTRRSSTCGRRGRSPTRWATSTIWRAPISTWPRSSLSPLDRLEEAVETARDGIALCEEVGLDCDYGVSLRAIATGALFELGRWDEAETLVADSAERSPIECAAIDFHLAGAKVAVGRGPLAAAERHLAAVARADDQHARPPVHGSVRRPHRRAGALARRPEDALAAVLDGLERADDCWFAAPLVWLGIRAAADLGDVATGERLARRASAAPTGRSPVLDAHAATCAAEATRLGAGARTRRRSPPPRPRGMAPAARYPSAYCRFREAEALLGQRHRRAAARALAAAFALAEPLGAAPLLAEMELLAQRGRIEVSPAAESAAAGPGRAGLTARELEVLTLVARGLTNRDVGQALFVTEKTASAHVSNILSKLSVRSRVEAAAAAHRLGLVEP